MRTLEELIDKILNFAEEHSTLTPIVVSVITSLVMWFLLKIFF